MFAHDHGVSHQALVGGYIVLALTLAATLGLTGWLLARRLHRPAIAIQLLVVLVGGGVSFQVVHFFDHLLQLGYWFAHPTETPWMPLWSHVAANDLATLAGYQDDMAAGMELLHVAGNWIFFAAGVIPLPRPSQPQDGTWGNARYQSCLLAAARTRPRARLAHEHLFTGGSSDRAVDAVWSYLLPRGRLGNFDPHLVALPHEPDGDRCHLACAA